MALLPCGTVLAGAAAGSSSCGKPSSAGSTPAKQEGGDPSGDDDFALELESEMERAFEGEGLR